MSTKPVLSTIQLGVTILVGPVSFAADAKSKPKPSVVYILSDNQSFHEMSCHGHALIKT